jgi:hypothetical protein
LKKIEIVDLSILVLDMIRPRSSLSYKKIRERERERERERGNKDIKGGVE